MSETSRGLEPVPSHGQDDDDAATMWDLSAAGAAALTSSAGGHEGNQHYDDSLLHDAELTSGIELEQLYEGRQRNPDQPAERQSVPESSSDSSETPSAIATPGGSMLAPDEHHPHHDGDSSVKQASFNFINAIIGAGIIGLPAAIRKAGFFAGMFLLCLVAGITYWSITLVVQLGVEHRQRTYERLARHVYGKPGYVVTSLGIFLYAWGAQLAYLVILGDTLGVVTSHWQDPDKDEQSVDPWFRRGMILAVAILIILPLSLLRRMEKLAKSSFVSLVAVAWIVLFILVRLFTGPLDADVPETDSERALRVIDKGFFQAVGIISFAFVCHHNTFHVFNSLRERTLTRWKQTSQLSIGVSVLTSSVLCISGFLLFRRITEGNILNNFSKRDEFANVTRLLYALTMVLTYPLENFVSRFGLHVMLSRGEPSQRLSNFRHYGFTLLLWSVSVLIAMVVTDLGAVLELTGGVSASIIGYIMPPLMQMRLTVVPWRDMFRTKEAARAWLPSLGVLLFGVVTLVVVTVTTIIDASSGSSSDDGPGAPP